MIPASQSARSRFVYFRMMACATFVVTAVDLRSACAEPTGTTVHAASEHSRPLLDQRLEAGDAVFGVVVGDEPRAYALSDLRTAGAAVHDIVSGQRIDVGFEAPEPRIIVAPDGVRDHRMTSWREWIALHPDTSLWRIPAIAEPEPRRPADDIRVTESHHYKTAFGCALISARPSAAPPGLFVITGTIENVTPNSVHHVVLRYELVGADGRVVYRDEGFNRSAEALAAPRAVDREAVVPAAAGVVAASHDDARSRAGDAGGSHAQAIDAADDHVVVAADDNAIAATGDRALDPSYDHSIIPADADAIVPIDAGRTDTFRMIFLADELPAFENARVTVARVY